MTCLGAVKEEFRAALKQGKKALRSGDPDKAERWFLRCRELTDHEHNKHHQAFVLHRLAEVAILQGDWMVARRRFKLAVKLIDKDSHLAYCILLRDFGEFERRQGHLNAAYKYVMQAASLADLLVGDSRRIREERAATKGIVARLDLKGKKRRQAIKTLKEVAKELYGAHKRQYELANLAILIEELPPWDLDRPRYLARAIVLSIQLRNVPRATKFTALLGGRPLRSAYRIVVR